MARIRAVMRDGRRYSNITQQYYFPRNEVYQFLRARKRSLSIEEWEAESEELLRDGCWQIYPIPTDSRARSAAKRSKSHRLTVERVETEGVINLEAWARKYVSAVLALEGVAIEP